MDDSLKKSVRNGLYGWCILFLISFFYGGIYNEIYLGKESLTILNIIFAFIGATFIGLFLFIPIFIFSLLYFYLREIKTK